MMNPTEVFSPLAELLPAAMALVTPHGEILATNPVFRAKYAADHQFCEELTTDHAKARTFLRDSTGSRALIPSHLQLKKLDGTYESAHVQAGLLTVEPPTVVLRVMPHAEAISHFGALNTKIDELSAEVERRQALEAQLQDAISRLTSDNQRKDEFLAMLAHELRNPLAPIRNAVELMKMRHDGMSREIKQASDIISRQVNHMVRMIDDLMDVSRITRGKIELKREKLNVLDVVTGAVESNRGFIHTKSHHLHLSLPEKPVHVVGDTVRLTQVLSNLLNNSAKYTKRDGNIWLTVENMGPIVNIRVVDNGVGMPPELLPRVFDLFVQSDRSLDRSEGGLGIGLTLVRRLVEMHGGTVTALSEGIDRGSTFIISLPAIPEDMADSKNHKVLVEDPSNAGTDPAKPSILIVDDNTDAAETAAMLLRADKYPTHVAYDGPSAIEIVKQRRPKVVILDIGLPFMNGFEVAKTLSREENPPVMIALSGYGKDEDKERGAEAGFSRYFVKPLDFGELRRFLVSL